MERERGEHPRGPARWVLAVPPASVEAPRPSVVSPVPSLRGWSGHWDWSLLSLGPELQVCFEPFVH